MDTENLEPEVTFGDLFNRAIGDHLVFVRTRQRPRMTREQLADASGVPSATIERIENGRVSPKMHQIAQLVLALGEDLGTFLTAAVQGRPGLEKLQGRKP